ncbi:hypothetical protein MASR2M78_04960 [Treponema sp.]
MLLGAAAFGMDWPNSGEKLRSDFGHNDMGRPNVGLVFVAQGAVKSADAGELFFARDSSDVGSSLPAPLGILGCYRSW